MAEYREHDVEKVSSPPLVHDTVHPDHTTDDDGAAGALIALDGAPVDGGVPTYDVGTGTHTSQVPSGAAGMAPTLVSTGTTFTIPDNKQVLYFMTIAVDGTITIGDNSYLILVG